MLRFLLIAFLFASPAFATEGPPNLAETLAELCAEKPKLPFCGDSPTVVCEEEPEYEGGYECEEHSHPLCPDLDALLESETFAGFDCKQRTKACKQVAAVEYKCETALAKAEAKTAIAACGKSKECRKEVRSILRETLKSIRSEKKSAKATCKAVCE